MSESQCPGRLTALHVVGDLAGAAGERKSVSRKDEHQFHQHLPMQKNIILREIFFPTPGDRQGHQYLYIIHQMFGSLFYTDDLI